MKNKKPLFIAGVSLVSAGFACALAAVILSIAGFEKISGILFIIASICGVASMVVLIYKVNKEVPASVNETKEEPKMTIKVVDVKDLPKSKEQQLYEQYENLYKQNLITKEELEQKKKDLLG